MRRGEWGRIAIGLRGNIIRLRRHLFYHKRVMLYHLRKAPSQIVQPKASVLLESVTNSNMLDAMTMIGPAAQSFQQMLTDGQMGFYVYLEGKVVHHSWVILNQSPVPKKCLVWLDLAWHNLFDGEAHIHNCETAGDVRGRGIYPFVLTSISQFLFHEKGCRTIFISVAEDNLSSIRGIEKAGFMPAESVEILNLLGLPLRFRRDVGQIAKASNLKDPKEALIDCGER
jgi:ribosomal protein S18 acetylase RimI-like enzyme